MNPVRIEVFYIGGKTGWAIALFDCQGNQIGEAQYEYKKNFATLAAMRMSNGLPIFEYNMQGKIRRIIK